MDDLQIREGLVIPGWELWFTASGSGGPGGQHANTSNTKITLHWSVDNTSVLNGREKRRVKRRLRNRINTEGVLQISESGQRSQMQNREEARRQLAEMVEEALKVQKRRIPTRPSRGARERRIKAKKERGQIKKMRKDPPLPRDH